MELQDPLPTGWDCKVDSVTGKHYYINHFTKTTTWQDPRSHHQNNTKPIHGNQKHFTTNKTIEHIPLQHGSPELRRNYVYPSQPSPIPAFQIPSNYSPKFNPLQELRSVSRMSPLSLRNLKVQDSTFCNNNVSDTDEAVGKISAMFPTVSDTHIRMLMKKYHNRDALVISALQVEKNPITTPGPYATPPPQRNIHRPGVHHTLHMTPPVGARVGSRGGSPGSGTTGGSPRTSDGYRSSPKPHSSPKLKLRYMKSIFPQAEETTILDILSNNDSNIQKTTEALKEMGFQRKDTVKAAQQKMEAKIEKEKKEEEKIKKVQQPPPLPKIKTSEEKAALKQKLKEQYKDVADHLINIALESVDYNKNRACQILDIMVQEEEDTAKTTQVIEHEEKEEAITECDSAATLPVSQSRQSIKSLMKSEKIDKDKLAFNRVVEESEVEYKSPNIIDTKGANTEIAKGPDDKMLLEDYVKWQGPNRGLRKGSQSLARGFNRDLLCNRTYEPHGSNPELRKGPLCGLAKGSIFSHLKSIMVGESRGK